MEFVGAGLVAIGAFMLVAAFFAPKSVQRWLNRGRHMNEQGAAEKRASVWTGSGVVIGAIGALLVFLGLK